MKFSVCTDSVFSGVPTAEAMETVRACGIKAIEFWNWQGKDLAAIEENANRLSMEIAAFCTSAVSLTDPSCREKYISELKAALAVAKQLKCKRLISQVGNDTGDAAAKQRQSIIDGLKACVPLLEAADVTLLVEPLNTTIDHIGYYLSSSKEGGEIIDAVNSENVRLLYDCYHQQITEGDIIRNIQTLGPRIGHIHTAGNPGRHELNSGEMRYEGIFAAIDEMKYDGYVGLEYYPLRDVKESLIRLQSPIAPA